jgi:hypothetical protein
MNEQVLMKITEYGSIKSATDIKRKRAVGGADGSFANLLGIGDAEEAGAASSLSDIAGTSSVSNLLALQEISEEEHRRKKLVQKGKNLLGELEKLRSQLLTGSVPLSLLQNLGHQLSVERQAVSDPKLLELMDEIELRAAVELAKLEMLAARDAMLP